MTKYVVTLQIDASVTVTVDADSETNAVEKAFKVVDNPIMCHHCSNVIEIGDFTGDAYVEMVN